MDWERVLSYLAIIATAVVSILWNKNRMSLHEKELSVKDAEINYLKQISFENLLERLTKIKEEMDDMAREYKERIKSLELKIENLKDVHKDEKEGLLKQLSDVTLHLDGGMVSANASLDTAFDAIPSFTLRRESDGAIFTYNRQIREEMPGGFKRVKEEEEEKKKEKNSCNEKDSCVMENYPFWRKKPD